MAKTSALKVVGVFESGWYEFDANLIYVTLPTAQSLFLMGDEADLVHLKLTDPFRARQVKEELGPHLLSGKRFLIKSWDQLAPDFFQALALEKLVMFIILLLIVLVASFNIIGTLIMIVIEKTREIGVMRAIGCGPRQIMVIFLLQGIVIGFMGTALGVLLGLIGCYGVEHWLPYYFKLPNAIYGLENLPVLVRWRTVGIIVAAAMVITVLASIIPAIQACRLKTVEALRYE
ncbi:ABC transporter permease [Candidatus Sumerlaeota bacterium]